MDLLAGDGPAIGPTTYDRFEAWWYGAAANSRRAFAADMRAWGSFRRGRGQPMIPAGAIDIRCHVDRKWLTTVDAISVCCD